MKPVITFITHPYPAEIMMARRDHAAITGQELIERPYWYHDSETGLDYHDLFGCIGWPSEASDRDNGLPGYAAVFAVERPKNLGKDVHYDPRDASFFLLCEAQSFHAPQLIEKCLIMREKYGFGLVPGLLTTFLGDPDRFSNVMALKNERLTEAGEQHAFLISPPDDFYVTGIWDQYVRAIRFSISVDDQRLGFLKNDILRTRIKEFRLNDPAVLAGGGMVYSLLNRCMWMQQANGSTIFSVEEAA